MKRGDQPTSGDTRLARRLRRANNALQWSDVDSNILTTESVVDDGCGIAQLPLSLLRDRVFPLLAPPAHSSLQVFRDGMDVDQYTAQLASLRAVCQSWYKLTQFLSSEYQKRQHVISFDTARRAEWKRIMRQSERDGAQVQELEITMDFYGNFMPSNFRVVESLDEEKWKNHASWDALFECYPNLERLDLSTVAVNCTELILSSASRFCPRLQALVLLCENPLLGLPVEVCRIASKGLVRALDQWHSKNGGLRLLTVPHWVVRHGNLYADFIGAVATFCPRIEYLLSKVPSQECTDVLIRTRSYVPLDVWTEFCRRCTRLREFSWHIAPCTREHIEIFNSTEKPQLTALHIDSGNSDLGAGATDYSVYQSMIAQLPTLQSFDFDLRFVPNVTKFSPTALDQLVKHLAAHCPKIETFRCHSTAPHKKHGISSDAIEALTRNGLVRYLHSNSADLNDNTLLKILTNIRPQVLFDHMITLEAIGNVHAPIERVLVYLAETPASRFATMTLQLHVFGVTPRRINKEPIELEDKHRLHSREELEELVSLIKVTHANSLSFIRVSVYTCLIGDEEVDMIDGLNLLMNVSQDIVNEEWAPASDEEDDEEDDDAPTPKSNEEVDNTPTVAERGGVFYQR